VRGLVPLLAALAAAAREPARRITGSGRGGTIDYHTISPNDRDIVRSAAI
jgi:hypothetical protein